ncbi:hypothetical protein ES707_02401 [subsurface metagenome]
MDKEILEFENWCKKSWGKPMRDNKLLFASGTPQIRQYTDFECMGNPLKMYIAEKLIFESCSRVGGYKDTGDIIWYIHNFVRDMKGDVDGFGGRIHQPLKASLLLIVHHQFSSALPSDRSDFDHILAGGAALSAMYLMARLENLFRIRSKYLNEDGTLRKTIPNQLRQILLRECGISGRGRNWRCNRINQAFHIFLYRNGTLLDRRLKIMNKKLKIADRLNYIRNPVMHGELEDPCSEARFLGLLVAMFYYNG